MTNNDLISEIEAQLPENTPENPEPTVFKVKSSDLGAHLKHIRSFPFNRKVKTPIIKPFVNKDELNETKDEYVFTSTDEKGETKITPNGHLLGGRKFLVTTFTLPGHGKKLYVLGGDAAKVTGYRDGFIMFSRFKNMFKYSVGEEYRPFFLEHGMNITKVKTRPIGLVTARSLFMFFGARVVQSGVRIKDDYWEDQIAEQGFDDKEQVFPVDKKQPTVKPASKSRAKTQAALYVTPLPLLEDRIEYLKGQSTGQVTQVLPGQGISGGLELSTISSIPKYTADPTVTVKHKNILNSLASNNTNPAPAVVQSTMNQLVISDESAGSKSITGLPIYSRNVNKRIKIESSDKLREIEYLHGAVETNSILSQARKPRNKTWQYYWQTKSGAPYGLIKEEEESFKKTNEETLKVVEKEVIFNDYLNCDQVITRRRTPNPNYLNHGNIKGLKPPYAERPQIPEPIPSATPGAPNSLPGLQGGLR